MSALIQTSFANEATAYWATEDQFITLSQAVANLSTDVENWSTYAAVSTINVSSNAITNVSSLQIDAQVLTANASELFLNGVPIATIPDISNVADWALYPALANIDANNFAISNVSGFELDGEQISALGNTILVNGLNPVSNWSSYQATTSLDMAGFNIFNTPSISISGNTQNVALTASGTQLLVDGQAVYVGPLPPSDTSNWANYNAVANVNMSGFAISNTPTISISGNTQNVVLTASGTQLLVDGSAVLIGGEWANYPAVTNVNISGFNVENISGLNAVNIVVPTITMCSSVTLSSSISLTANDTQLLVNGSPVYTGALPPSDTSNWANFPAVANVNMSGKNILGFGNLGIIANDISLTSAASCNIYLNGNTKAKNIDITQGHINQCNVVGDGTTNQLAAATTFGDSANLGYVEVKGANRVAGFSSFYVEGGVTFDGGTLHGFRATSATIPIPIFGFGSARIELTPLLTAMVSVGPCYIASGTFTAVQALLNARLEAGTFVTITHGNLGGFDGIYLQNTLNNGSNTRIILTAGGTIYNIGNTQTSNLFTPQPIQFWSNVYNPSGGSTPVPPSVGIHPKNPIVYNDVNRNNNLLGNYVGWFGALGAYETSPVPLTAYASLSTFSNTTLIGNFPSVGNFLGGFTPLNYGNSSVHIGQQTISADYSITPPTLGDRAVAIGTISGWTGNATADNIILGTHINSITGQGSNCIAIGVDTGVLSQGANAVAVGNTAGQSNQGNNSVAIGTATANVSQGVSAVAIGLSAGQITQGSNAVAIGVEAGSNTQGTSAVAIGSGTAGLSQGVKAIAIGFDTAYSNQASNAIAIGNTAGFSNQLADAIAIGAFAGYSNQSLRAVAIGSGAGAQEQGADCVAIGTACANVSQGVAAVAIGLNAGQTTQGTNAIAIGANAGFLNQGMDSIAIGLDAGYSNAGSNSIAIGRLIDTIQSGTIVLNATGVNLDGATPNSTYIAPMRAVQNSNAYQNSLMTYDTTTKEVGYATNAYSIQVVATSGTAIALNPTLRGKTFILTGTTTQAFTTTALGANDTGFFVVAHNGNGVNGGDINMTGMTGTNVLHERTNQRNNGTAYLYWNGTGLVGY